MLALCASMLISTHLWADFESAADAYRLRNYASAYLQFLPLAEQGDPRAQTIIAMMYKFGEAVEQDKVESFKWYGKAAEQGYAPAQYLVGEMYANGFGVEIDRSKAIIWLSKAAAAGYAKADNKLAELKGRPEFINAQRDEPIPWSQAWNLRLPDDIRYGVPAPAPTKTEKNRDIYRVQLGAMKSLASASRLWSIVRDPNKDLFKGLEPFFKSDLPHKRIKYRLQTGPFDSLLTAKQFCDQLLDRGVTTGCLPILPHDDANS